MTQERALEVQELGARTEYPMTQIDDAVMFEESPSAEEIPVEEEEQCVPANENPVVEEETYQIQIDDVIAETPQIEQIEAQSKIQEEDIIEQKDAPDTPSFEKD